MDEHNNDESYEMLKASYNFQATFAKTLSFKQNDMFIRYGKDTRHQSWWMVMNDQGLTGYIPSNYVTSVLVSPEMRLQFLDSCINCLNEASNNKPELLHWLREQKQDTELRLGGCPQNSEDTTSNSGAISHENKKTESEENVNVDGVEGSASNSERHDAVVTTHCNSVSEQSETQVYQLVEKVRNLTQLSHEMSQSAVSLIVSSLRDMLPPSFEPELNSILSHLKVPLSAPAPMIEETRDACRLRVIFDEMTYCKDDSQQRSWMLHEDEQTILEYLKELISILTNADPQICCHVMSQDKYEYILSLVQYYQMEIRRSIRQLLVEAFGVMCGLDVQVLRLLLNSVLPMELAREMYSNADNIRLLSYTSLLLTMIFSLGEPMPITHNDHAGGKFISFLLNLVEEPPETDVEEQLPGMLINLILAYNLQFNSIAENIVIKTLGDTDTAKVFTEKLLLLLNREEDPVRLLDHEPAPPHSVLKLFIDMFRSENTSKLFYTNDVKVLIDIIVRQLTDLSPGDKRRKQYLELCDAVMRNTCYSEHNHRKEDILKCFTRILSEDSEKNAAEQEIVKHIANEFFQQFSC